MSSEFARIAAIRSRFGRSSGSVVLGIGDDAALLRPEPGCDVAVTSDLLVEGVHFRLEWTSPELLGHKALAVSMSDLAAMGARPRAAFLSIACPSRITDQFLESFYVGAGALANRFDLVIAGGDLSRSPGPLVVDSVLVGEVPAGRALRRSGARAGDLLFVSGTLGSSAAGLAELRRGVTIESVETGADLRAIRSHLAPTPRTELGCALASSSLASAAIDVSDGLSSDLQHLCDESGVGTLVFADALPTSYDLDLALHGGEQYELLFAAPPEKAESIATLAHRLKVPVTRIGRFESDPSDVRIESDGVQRPLEPRGWDHFSAEAREE